MENEKIVVIKNGKEVECDVLFTFDSEDTNKSYIAYTDNVVIGNKKTIYVSSFDPILGYGSLEDITTNEELEMVKDVLESIDSQVSNQ